MNRSKLFYAAACQTDQPNPKSRSEIRRSTDALLALAERAVVGYRPFHDVKLVVFPEFALAAPVYATAEELAEKLALPAENEHIERLAEKARELGCYIQTGSFLEVDERYRDCVFNTTLLLSPKGETILRYRKVNPWIPWEVHASPHDILNYEDELFPVADTDIGRIGTATCYDWLFPETTRELALKGAEILVRISAYMDPWGATAPLDWWTSVNRVRALENTAFVVAANQAASAGRYPPFSWPGGSMIVDYDGRILSQANPGAGEQIVVGPVSIATLREERSRRQGHAMLAHLRTEAYKEARVRRFSRSLRPEDRTVEALDESIRRSKRRIGFGDET